MPSWVTLLTHITLLFFYVTDFDVFVAVLNALPDVAFVVVDGHKISGLDSFAAEILDNIHGGVPKVEA